MASIPTRPFDASVGDLLSQSRYDAVPKRGDLRRDNKRAESRGRSQLTVTVKPERYWFMFPDQVPVTS